MQYKKMKKEVKITNYIDILYIIPNFNINNDKLILSKTWNIIVEEINSYMQFNDNLNIDNVDYDNDHVESNFNQQFNKIIINNDLIIHDTSHWEGSILISTNQLISSNIRYYESMPSALGIRILNNSPNQLNNNNIKWLMCKESKERKYGNDLYQNIEYGPYRNELDFIISFNSRNNNKIERKKRKGFGKRKFKNIIKIDSKSVNIDIINVKKEVIENCNPKSNSYNYIPIATICSLSASLPSYFINNNTDNDDNDNSINQVSLEIVLQDDCIQHSGKIHKLCTIPTDIFNSSIKSQMQDNILLNLSIGDGLLSINSFEVIIKIASNSIYKYSTIFKSKYPKFNKDLPSLLTYLVKNNNNNNNSNNEIILGDNDKFYKYEKTGNTWNNSNFMGNLIQIKNNNIIMNFIYIMKILLVLLVFLLSSGILNIETIFI
jgi:hypothetical protein